MKAKDSTEKTIRDIRRATRKHYSSEEKIRIVLEGLRGEQSIAELCRGELTVSNNYFFMNITPILNSISDDIHKSRIT